MIIIIFLFSSVRRHCQTLNKRLFTVYSGKCLHNRMDLVYKIKTLCLPNCTINLTQSALMRKKRLSPAIGEVLFEERECCVHCSLLKNTHTINLRIILDIHQKSSDLFALLVAPRQPPVSQAIERVCVWLIVCFEDGLQSRTVLTFKRSTTSFVALCNYNFFNASICSSIIIYYNLLAGKSKDL